MRIALAPNAFRGSLTALQAIESLSFGLRRSQLFDSQALELIPLPLADGGDGTMAVMLHDLGGERLPVTVSGPDGEPVRAEIGLLSDGSTAVIEMAQASGVELLPLSRRNPLITSTYGTGELFVAARERGYTHFILGLGGSATVDGGAGCLQAMGAHLLDVHGAEIPRGGGGLSMLASIDANDIRQRFEGTEITILCDVTNPLLGPRGASHFFGPQKGATPEMVEALEHGLHHFANVLQRDLGADVAEIPGTGAAGGFGAGLIAMLHAALKPGAPTLMQMLGYEEKLKGCNLVITGEGKLDAQTEGGKAVQRIAEVAKRAAIPVVAFAGMLDADRAALRAMGIQAAWSIVPGPVPLADALANAGPWLERAACTLGDMLAGLGQQP